MVEYKQLDVRLLEGLDGQLLGHQTGHVVMLRHLGGERGRAHSLVGEVVTRWKTADSKDMLAQRADLREVVEVVDDVLEDRPCRQLDHTARALGLEEGQADPLQQVPAPAPTGTVAPQPARRGPALPRPQVVVVDVGVEVGGARWAGHLPSGAASGPGSRQQSLEHVVEQGALDRLHLATVDLK